LEILKEQKKAFTETKDNIYATDMQSLKKDSVNLSSPAEFCRIDELLTKRQKRSK
jgi:hypothetical protein